MTVALNIPRSKKSTRESSKTKTGQNTPSASCDTGNRRRVLFLTGWNSHPLHKGIADYAKEANWILDNEMCYSGRIPERWTGDGILCRHAFRDDIINFTQAAGLPAVGWEESSLLPIPSVYFNQEATGRKAAEHLLARGYKNLGFFHLRLTDFQAPRMEGFRRAAEKGEASFVEMAPDKAPPWPLPIDYEWRWAKKLLKELGTPGGIMVSNDALARPLIYMLEAQGLSVPEQIALVGAENDTLLCEMSSVPVSSVETRMRDMGREAAALLDRLMRGQSPSVERLLIEPGEVVVRRSSDMLAASNIHAAKVLRYIWDHYREPISVEDIARIVPISRRGLQTVFRKNFGRTIQAEIIRVRVEAACRLLQERKLKVSEIAESCGFSSSLHLHRSIRSALDMGPRDYMNVRDKKVDSGIPCPLT